MPNRNQLDPHGIFCGGVFDGRQALNRIGMNARGILTLYVPACSPGVDVTVPDDADPTIEIVRLDEDASSNREWSVSDLRIEGERNSRGLLRRWGRCCK